MFAFIRLDLDLPGSNDTGLRECCYSQLGSRAAAFRHRQGLVERRKLADARAADRKAQVGSGDRSERIRTYNFPQGRVTDHRINLTLYKIDKVMEGEAVDEILDPLIADHQARLLAESEEGEA